MKRLIGLFALVVGLLALPAAAQVANEGLANGIIQARAKNSATLQQYIWNSRTEVYENQQLKDVRIDQVQYGPDGNLQRTIINDQPARVPHGFFRRMVAQSEAQDMESYLGAIAKVVDQYTLPAPGKVVDFLSTAQVQPVTTPEGTTVLQVTGSNVIVPGDSFSMNVDGRTLLPASVQVTTTVKEDTVTLSATFRSIPGGPNHLQYATVQSPAKNLTVNIHNYDYVPNN